MVHKTKRYQGKKRFRDHSKRNILSNAPVVKITRSESTSIVVGTVIKTKFGFSLTSTDRREKAQFIIRNPAKAESHAGELVVARLLASSKFGRQEVEITHVLGDANDPKNISLIAIHGNGIPFNFSDAALREAAEIERDGLASVLAASPPPLTPPSRGGESGRSVGLGAALDDVGLTSSLPLEGLDRMSIKREGGAPQSPTQGFIRTDLREIPLVTIDGPDARDFDDAVFAEATPEGWHLLVAIADVAHYVRSGSALNNTAYERGNSVYFPDRVVPMLPEALSNELCSLKPKVERACMAVHLWLDKEGELTRWEFVRGLMRSRARLTYEQVQAAMDGKPDHTTAPLLDPVIKPLYGAFRCLMQARLQRGTLELDLPERKVELGADGKIKAIKVRERLDSHKLIEEFMICANVAAAAQLESQGGIALYRIHDRPTEMKLLALREFLDGLGISLVPAQQLHPRMLTQILEKAAGGPHAEVVNEVMLRSQAQAVYSKDNIGHFGLALAKYAHFTSPIRRYADLIVHRGLIRACHLGEDGLTDTEIAALADIAEHISQTERRAATAEREAVDRYTTLYLADKVDAVFQARISGVTRFGLFARLDDSGADGIIPFGSLPNDFYNYDEKRQAMVGQRHGKIFQLAQRIAVRLEDADVLTGSLRLAVVDADTKSSPAPARRHKPPRDSADKPRPRKKPHRQS
jgi:ribonuclease R